MIFYFQISKNRFRVALQHPRGVLRFFVTIKNTKLRIPRSKVNSPYFKYTFLSFILQVVHPLNTKFINTYFCRNFPLMNEIPHDVSFVTGTSAKISSKFPQSFSSLSELKTSSIDFWDLFFSRFFDILNKNLILKSDHRCYKWIIKKIKNKRVQRARSFSLDGRNTNEYI